MPQSIRDRGGRLSAFARGSSNGLANYDIPAHPDREQPEVPVQTRQELAEAARVSIPKNTRHATSRVRDGAVSSQPAPGSPRKGMPVSPPHGRGRANSNLQGNMFEGSELGESFMYSGRSSPKIELDEKNENVSEDNKDMEIARVMHRGPSRTQFDMPAQGGDRQGFLVGDDGKVRVVPGGARHNASYMKDGFQNGAPNGHHRSSSSVERHSNLPLREVKLQKSRSGMFDGYIVKDGRRAISPGNAEQHVRPKRDDHRRSTIILDREEEVDFSDEHEELQVTPKAKSKRAAPQKALFEDSMPSAVVPYKPLKEKKRPRASPDYDDMALSSMTYDELQREPFDMDPARVSIQNGHAVGGDRLAARLEQFRHQGEKEQRHMFATMTIDDWEASGDWFVDQFTDLMQRLKRARQNKRQMTQEFENEAASREEAVRLRSEAIDRKLVKMKQNGQRVVEARDP